MSSLRVELGAEAPIVRVSSLASLTDVPFTAGSVGIGFDIPAATAKMVVAQLKEHGKVTRGWLGVQIQPVTAGIAEGLGLKKAQGAIVDEIEADSPAAKAGLESGDVVIGEGSGFFISADGYAVTNYHVVDHAKSVHVTADDGMIYTAKVIGADQKTDLALIKVDGKNDFPFVKFADHTPRVGDWVVAVGNPFGLGGTVTAGIVSARGRDIGAGPYDDYMQIDAPINKGNSGGPAFDVNGDVVGVNTAIYSSSG
jgi:S1-C subfamily serine protease